MNAQRREADLHPNDPTTTQANGSPHLPHINGRDFARRAKALISKWPLDLDAQMKSRPYTALGVALALGMGTGILLGSRILRSVMASAVSYAAIELGRMVLRESTADVVKRPS